jgi:hypothetical protein
MDPRKLLVINKLPRMDSNHDKVIQRRLAVLLGRRLRIFLQAFLADLTFPTSPMGLQAGESEEVSRHSWLGRSSQSGLISRG